MTEPVYKKEGDLSTFTPTLSDKIRAVTAGGVSGNILISALLSSLGIAQAGWMPVTDTWTYASASTITVSSGAAAIYKVGQGLKLNNTDTKYFYIVGVADTLLTITGGSDYTLDSDAISAISYTNTPGTAIGFPQVFNWTPTITAAVGTYTTVTNSDSKFSMDGKKIRFRTSQQIVTNGTAAGYMLITLPIARDAAFVDAPGGSAINNGTGGFLFGLNCVMWGTNQILVYKYDATYPGANGYRLTESGEYIAA